MIEAPAYERLQLNVGQRRTRRVGQAKPHSRGWLRNPTRHTFPAGCASAASDVATRPRVSAAVGVKLLAVIAVPNTTASALAAKAATQTIPIVLNVGGDPAEIGLVTPIDDAGA